jgi:3-oxoacyl-[acyl-carrier protein] reductase
MSGVDASRFDDVIVLVTGAAQGIGFATARSFASLGAMVWCADMNGETLMTSIERIGAGCTPFVGDLADDATRTALMRSIEDRDGRLDVLVNNAGPPTADPRAQESFNDAIAASLGMYGAMCRLVIPLMVGRAGGSIVNVASIAGMVGLGSDWYASAKAGAVGLSVRLACELGPLGIRVNAVAPGVIATPRTASMLATGSEALVAVVPLRRVGTPEDVAGVICFLASDAASYVTGCVIKVDGGLECAPAWSGSSSAVTA